MTVANRDSHDHNGGDGARINHTNLSNIGAIIQAPIDGHIARLCKRDGCGAKRLHPLNYLDSGSQHLNVFQH